MFYDARQGAVLITIWGHDVLELRGQRAQVPLALPSQAEMTVLLLQSLRHRKPRSTALNNPVRLTPGMSWTQLTEERFYHSPPSFCRDLYHVDP